MEDLTRPVLFGSAGEELLEKVIIYSYEFVEVAAYTIFRFSMGVDNWLICLDDPYPRPIIRAAFPGHDLELIWYNEDQ